MLYKMRYEKDKANSKSLLDSCINYFNKSLAINPHQYSSNYNLGILYITLVDIMEELDIDADLEMVILMQDKQLNIF